MIKRKKSRTLFRHDDQTKKMILNHHALRATQTVTRKNILLENIRKETVKNKQTKRLQINDKTTKQNDIVTYHELIFVFKTLRNEVMQQEHDAFILKHFEIDKTMIRLTKKYY